jgi:creatinine amidohydrolase
MPSFRLFHELTREELRTAAPESLIVFPVGATEQHGPHLPVATDHLTVEHIAREAAREASASIPVIVAPTLPFGSSHHHLPFGGTMSLGTEVYYRAVYDLCESLVSGGFRRIFILNGHGGNNELVQLVARDLTLKHPVHVAAASYWVAAWDALAAAHGEGGLPGHAGIFETSIMMALRPELVREPRPHRELMIAGSGRHSPYPAVRIERHGSWQAINGHTDSPDLAEAERGKAYLAAAVGAVSKAFIGFYEAKVEDSE